MAADSPRAATLAFITTARRSGKDELNARFRWRFLQMRRPMLAAIPVQPVSSDYTTSSSVFNGKVHWVQIDVGKDSHDHFISPEERLNLAMARQ